MISLTPVGELVSGLGGVIWIFILAGSRLLGWPRGWVSSLMDRVFFRYQIGPLEVENALMEHPAVVETAVISSPDPVQGEVMWEQQPVRMGGSLGKQVHIAGWVDNLDPNLGSVAYLLCDL